MGHDHYNRYYWNPYLCDHNRDYNLDNLINYNLCYTTNIDVNGGFLETVRLN